MLRATGYLQLDNISADSWFVNNYHDRNVSPFLWCAAYGDIRVLYCRRYRDGVDNINTEVGEMVMILCNYFYFPYSIYGFIHYDFNYCF
jgi:hypothetical protein